MTSMDLLEAIRIAGDNPARLRAAIINGAIAGSLTAEERQRLEASKIVSREIKRRVIRPIPPPAPRRPKRRAWVQAPLASK
jgi:hypothetical protein